MPNHFDRIFKENIEALFPYLIKVLLGIDISHSETIKDKLHVTLEREPDFLKIIRDEIGRRILHIEFEGGELSKMTRRMLLYKSILITKYNLEVLQYVIYIGRQKSPKLHNRYKSTDLSFSYRVIHLGKIDAALFLGSDTPEGVIMAILADFKGESSEILIQTILVRLRELISVENGLEKYIRQLRILSLLRKLHTQTIQQIEKMELDIKMLEKDLKRDPWYRKGIEEGRISSKREMIINLILKMNLDDLTIADLTDATIEYIQEIRKELGK